jgi:DNA mismatch repair ATPase MutS
MDIHVRNFKWHHSQARRQPAEPNFLKKIFLQLTKRATKDKQRIVDMCGIPIHALDNYLHRLIKKGVMVAVCEQTGSVDEAKKMRTRVKREITRLFVFSLF